jgi:ABC-type transport system substrate-binding protein
VIDAPGPWGTGPFILAEGLSVIDAEQSIIQSDPFACTWIWSREQRAPRVRLVANEMYWDQPRGPRLQEIILRNDLSPEQALDLVCTTEGEVDIVTEVPPSEAHRVKRSVHAKLVSIGALRSVAGVFNRDAEGSPLRDKRARQALNFAINRKTLVADALLGFGSPLAGLTPPDAVTFLHRLSPYDHDAATARKLWAESGAEGYRLRIATTRKLDRVANAVAQQVQEALGVGCDAMVYDRDEELRMRRLLAERQPVDWDIFILEQCLQLADAPPLELHRAFVGETGEYRAGPVIAEFEALYRELVAETSRLKIPRIAYRIDKFVHEEALALFLCAPDALYAVNKHVDFKPYRTTFELADCEVSADHWSRKQ